MRQTQCHTGRQRDRQRHTGRQTDTDTQAGRQRQTTRDRETKRDETDTETHKKANLAGENRQASLQVDRHAGRRNVQIKNTSTSHH